MKYERPKEESTLSYGSGSKQPDSAGVKYGLNAHMKFDSSEGGLVADHTYDSVTGNYPGRPKVNPEVNMVSAKGKKFTFC